MTIDSMRRKQRKDGWRSARPGVPSLCALLLLGASSGVAQLPPAPPTAPVPAVSAVHRERRSQVRFKDGLLSIEANNASLNGVIREIARQTGMTVTGSIAEDRVFGSYGPGDPQRVLTALLDGTGTNILIVSNAAEAPVKLILTPRTGAATPPNPNEVQEASEQDDEEQTRPGAASIVSPPRGRPATIPGRVAEAQAAPAAPVPDAPQPSSTNQPIVFPPIDATSVPSTGTTTPVDPSNASDPSTEGAKTPQQIFEQLQRLRQQRTNPTPDPQDQ